MKTEELEDVVQEVRLNLQYLAERVGRISHVLLEGNGKPALTEQVAILVHKVGAIEEAMKETRVDNKLPKAAWLGIVVSIMLGLPSFVALVM